MATAEELEAQLQQEFSNTVEVKNRITELTQTLVSEGFETTIKMSEIYNQAKNGLKRTKNLLLDLGVIA